MFSHSCEKMIIQIALRRGVKCNVPNTIHVFYTIILFYLKQISMIQYDNSEINKSTRIFIKYNHCRRLGIFILFLGEYNFYKRTWVLFYYIYNKFPVSQVFVFGFLRGTQTFPHGRLATFDAVRLIILIRHVLKLNYKNISFDYSVIKKKKNT